MSDASVEMRAAEAQSRVPDIVVITGMSGSGRTQAMHALEDMGYTMITIRSQRLMDPTKFDNIVRQRVAPLLGVTPPRRTGLFAQRSDDLRSQLLG